MGVMVNKLRDRKRQKFHDDNGDIASEPKKEGFGESDADLSEGEKEKIMQEELETVVLNRCMEKVKAEMKDQARQFKGKLDSVDSRLKDQFIDQARSQALQLREVEGQMSQMFEQFTKDLTILKSLKSMHQGQEEQISMALEGIMQSNQMFTKTRDVQVLIEAQVNIISKMIQDKRHITMNHTSCEEISPDSNLFNKLLKKTSTSNRRALSKNNQSLDNQNYLQQFNLMGQTITNLIEEK